MKKFLISAICIITAVCAFAQEPMRTTYFLDGYDFRHQLNPAFASARSYFSLPVHGYVNANVQSNLGINTFLYPGQNGMVTFLHESVSTDTFMKKIGKNNSINVGFSTPILSIGAWGKGNGFTTIDLNIKSFTSINIPRDVFSALKSFGAQENYDLGNFKLNNREYLELAVGYTHRIHEKASIGFKLKFLAGLANVDLSFNVAQAQMSQDVWKLKYTGIARASVGKFFQYSSEDGMDIDPSRLLTMKPQNILGGYGFAGDLGFWWEITKGLTLSASVTDLGVMFWNNNTYLVSDVDWEFNGMDVDVTSPDGFKNMAKEKLEDLKNQALTFEQQLGSPKITEMLAGTVHAGLEYKMPFWKGMSVGALVTSRINGKQTWTEGRASLNFAFGNALSLTGSYAYSNFGSSIGAALNLHCSVFSLYLAMDSIPTKYSTPYTLSERPKIAMGLPVGKANVGVSAGLVFNVSKRKDLHFKEKVEKNDK